ncbi:MAG: LacI family DNA-binding transcriptional regulator [Propioniciclava sp.]|uniref:LacI family DNA-binding transcriptional regulator n=1 Tax=Propioniciclava sp. TaxID=2038686 RepID=UPI0039E49DCA
MARQITLKDVAAHAGVSRTTASSALSGGGRVSSETRERVHRAMRELGYVYHRGAASLRTQQTRTIGIVVTHIASPFWGELLVGLEAAFAEAGYLSVIVASGNDPVRQDALVSELREQRIAGLAMGPATGTPARLVEQLNGAAIPHVMMTRRIEGAPTWFVGPDDVEGGRLAGQHLAGHGCRSFAYVGGPAEMRARAHRARGVRDALAGHGLDPDAMISIPAATTGDGGLWAGERLLERGDLPEAIVCHSDTVAFGVYRALRARGRADGVRIVGYDDVSMAALWEPPLTTVATRPELLGRQSAALLLDILDEGGPGGRTRDAEGFIAQGDGLSWLRRPELRIRQSCGCPAAP